MTVYDEPYWKTPYGQYGRYQWRQRTGMSFYSFDSQPPQKSTRTEQKIEFQKELLKQMRDACRRSYQLSTRVAAEVYITPDSPTPPHIHTTVKKLLDLFGKPVEKSIKRKGLVYQNDNQIAYLSIRYNLGDKGPSIFAHFAPFRHFLLDVELADKILTSNFSDILDSRGLREEIESLNRPPSDLDARDKLREILSNEANYLKLISKKAYDAMVLSYEVERQVNILELCVLRPSNSEPILGVLFPHNRYRF